MKIVVNEPSSVTLVKEVYRKSSKRQRQTLRAWMRRVLADEDGGDRVIGKRYWETVSVRCLPFLLLLLCGCDKLSGPVWIERQVPITEEQRRAMAAHVECVASCLPSSVSGDDQDLEDVIHAAQSGAARIFCPITYWERAPLSGGNWEYTGRWRYAQTNQ